ncbi:hypothetical protein [Salmonirosea aquatica]|uniref:Secreted protein n=1 Tax=Salmonirosea aquatica TaxID=2654236 RepID=A0A7C9FRT3_9BACT|nr:hypothetical protein [Cytophagaceae bacterium SJW1-29]
MKRNAILWLTLACTASILPWMCFGQTGPASGSRQEPLPTASPLPGAVYMLEGERFPFPAGVAVSERQWEYERRQRTITRTVQLAVDAQLPPVTAPCVCPPPARPPRWAWVRPALRGFGAGVLAGALLINMR